MLCVCYRIKAAKIIFFIFVGEYKIAMKASISYQELQRLIAEQTQQPISFEFVDPKTVKVLYELNLGLMKKKVGIDLKVLEIAGTNLRVRYAAGFGMDGLVRMGLKMMKGKIPAGMLEEMPDHVLLVHLDKVDQIKPVLERIDLRDVNMLAEAVELVGDFK